MVLKALKLLIWVIVSVPWGGRARHCRDTPPVPFSPAPAANALNFDSTDSPEGRYTCRKRSLILGIFWR